jgi:hypothetical protein
VPAFKPLVAFLLCLASAPAAAGAIDLSATGDGGAPKVEASARRSAAAIDAPPVLPLFAGALALLGWRLGRRRTR